MMDHSDVETTKSEPWIYCHTILSQQVMSPTPLARVIMTVNYQPTLQHVRMLITQLDARVQYTLDAIAGSAQVR